MRKVYLVIALGLCWQGIQAQLILDFRGNGGGSVIDTRLFTDYLITHSAVSPERIT